uniref:Uncharacterized protein n=1 Tax=Heterorhabditis bacteriophora TaxID=37862 RepID=A0A1I7XQW3_HETBA
MAMDKVEKEAKIQGIEVPIILSDLDEKTGAVLSCKKRLPRFRYMWHMMQILRQKKSNDNNHTYSSSTLSFSYSLDKTEQTEESLRRDGKTQTEQQKNYNKQVETQTDDVIQVDVEAQTVTVDTVDSEMFTSSMPCTDTNCQTEKIQTKEQELQTYLKEMIDASTTTEMEVKNARIQTPCPVIEAKTIQTDNLEERKSPSKMSSARKRLRRAFAKPSTRRSSIGDAPAMSEWKDVDDGEIQEEDIGSVESLHWDPVDGLHAEKQQPVSKLTALFDRNFESSRRNRSQ